MTERGRDSLDRSGHHFAVGPSSMTWDGTAFVLSFDEIECPIPRRIKGQVRIEPQAFTRFETALDDQGLHRWGPIAPCARVELTLADGSLKWAGQGYLDSNSGDEPIETPFRLWDWSRCALPDGRTAVTYDVALRTGAQRLITQVFATDGSSEPFSPPKRQALPRTAWGLKRATLSQDDDAPPQVVQTLEDTPFYVRDVVSVRVLNQAALAVHETLDTNRLRALPIRMLLPFRMPRRA